MPTYNNKVVLRNGTVVLDVTPTTAVESDVASGKIFVKADGSLGTGTASGGGGGTTYVLEERTVTSSQWSSSYPYYYLVYLDDGVVDGETYTVSWDGVDYQMLATYDDMEEEMHIGSSDDPVYFIFYGDTAGSAGYAYCKTKADHTFSISYSGSAINLQQKDVNYIPTESYILDNITPSTGYQGLSAVNVTVDAIPSNYVGSGITRRSSSDLSASGATVTVPAGYYASQASKSVDSGTAGTPTATKGAVSNHAVTVTPSVTNVAGYISGGTINGTGVSVAASELVSGTYTVDSSGTKDVTSYASASVPAGTAGTPTATKGTVSNHSVTVTPKVVNTEGFISGGTKTGTGVSVSASELVSGSETKTANGTYDVTNLAELVVAVPAIEIPTPGDTVVSQKTIAANGWDDDGTKLVCDPYAASDAIIEGATYTITYDGTDYICTAGQSPNGDIGVGSLTWSFNDYPFFITTYKNGSGYSGWTAIKRATTASHTFKVIVSEVAIIETLNVTTNGTYNAPTGKAYDPVVVNVSGSGGVGTLLATKSLGTISTTSTQAADTGQTVSVTGINDYDLLIVETSVNSVTNNRHTATVGMILLTASSTVGTKNGATVCSNKWNSKISSSAVTTTRQGTTAYGIYPNSCSISSGTATIAMYQRYNSTSTGTINGSYTTRVYGVKLYDLIGG